MRSNINERFDSKVKKTKTCWLWFGGKNEKGYGIFFIKRSKRTGKTTFSKSHRFSWERHYKRKAGKKCVLHKCDVAQCVRPSHLFLGTRLDNNRDMIRKGRYVNGNKGKSGPRGEACSSNKYSEIVIRRVFFLKTKGLSRREIEAKTGINRNYIGQILSGDRWKDLQYIN